MGRFYVECKSSTDQCSPQALQEIVERTMDQMNDVSVVQAAGEIAQ